MTRPLNDVAKGHPRIRLVRPGDQKEYNPHFKAHKRGREEWIQKTKKRKDFRYNSESGAAVVDDEGGRGREAAVVGQPLRPAEVRHRS